jgi:hypothetical protein
MLPILPARLQSVDVTAREWSDHPDRVAADLARLAPSAGSALMTRSGADLLALQGIAGVHWGQEAPDQLTLTFANESFRVLADNVLRDAVGGVALVLQVEQPAPGRVRTDAPLEWWSNSSSQMTNSVRAMPGVVSSTGIVEHGQRDLMFTTADAAASARLHALVNDRLGNWDVHWLPMPPATPPA